MLHRAKILYREAQRQTDIGFGDVMIHAVEMSSGIELVKVQEHSIFLVESHVTSTEVWNGVSQGQHHWEPGAIAFLPARSDLTSTGVSNPYSETVIRLPDHILRNVAAGEDFSREFQFAAVPPDQVARVALAAKGLAMTAAPHPVVVDTISAALAAAVIYHCMPAAGRIQMERIRRFPAARKKKVLEFIHANLFQQISLGEIADVAALSRFHFSRSFKAEMGMSIMRYITLCRINEAKRMLAQGDLSVVCVAMTCGFSSQSHFASTFKQVTGMSPSQFRRSIK